MITPLPHMYLILIYCSTDDIGLFSEFSKVEIFKACFPAHFEDCCTILLQVAEILRAAIVNHIETILPLHANKANLNMNVFMKQQSQIDALGRQMQEDLSEISFQQHAKQQHVRPRSSPTGKVRLISKKNCYSATFADILFCWSHGSGHYTSDCCKNYQQFPN